MVGALSVVAGLLFPSVHVGAQPPAPQPQQPAAQQEPQQPAPQQPPQVPDADGVPDPGETEGPPQAAPSGSETRCDDGADDDGDGMIDCADADCFEAGICEAGGNEERNDERCSDWIDNDGDGSVDCDDSDCNGPGIAVCRGSMPGGSGQSQPGLAGADDLPELTGDMTVEDLIGNFGDADGERNDYLCADGIDNDGDGRTDCADFGCRFDAQVTVCQGSPGIRFSVVAGVGAFYEPDNADVDGGSPWDVRFTRIQLRALGQIPMIEDSFFILSTRWDKSPRLSFAHFQVPVGDTGFFAAVNSGSGSLTSGLIISASKHPLLDPPFYLYNAFEQGSGAAVEFGGPITDGGDLRFRLFASGGTGRSTGSVGGRFLPERGDNFAWGAGGQLGINFIGYFDRFDSPYLYTPVPLTLGVLIGGKYDQRPRERYPWGNIQLLFQYSRFLLRGEANLKYVLPEENLMLGLDHDGALQLGWNAVATVLLVPRMFMFAADIGQFYAQDFEGTFDFGGSVRRPLDELQFRAALHWYWYRSIGLLSLMYRHAIREQDPERPEDPMNPTEDFVERELRLEAQFRF